MKVLGLDSATVACSAAVWVDGKLLSRRHEVMGRGQSEALIPMTEEVFAEADLQASDLDLIAVTVGPGAFTGLRIALATALGLSLASGVEAAGVTTMEALAYGARAENVGVGQIITALDSRRDDIYLQGFSEAGRSLGDVEAVVSEALGPWVEKLDLKGPVTLIGDAAERTMDLLTRAGLSVRSSFAYGVPDAAHVAALAADKKISGLPLLELRPLYLRPPDAVVPKHGGRLRA